MPNELRNAQLLTVRLGLQWNRWSIIRHAKHITGYVQFEHFERWKTMWVKWWI